MAQDPFDFSDDPLAGRDDMAIPSFDAPESGRPPNETSDPGYQSFAPPGASSSTSDFPPPAAGGGTSDFPPPSPGSQPYGNVPPGSGASPPGAPAPGYLGDTTAGGVPPYGAPPQKKKGKGCLFWGFIIALLFALLMGGCGAYLYFSGRGVSAGANEFLAEAEAGNFAAAEALVAPGCTIPADRIERDLGGLSDHLIIGIANIASGSVTFSDSRVSTITMDMVEGDDGWKVCDYSLADTVGG